ncbi:MAG TPA: cell wall protein [Micromonosporaceae bacterium]
MSIDRRRLLTTAVLGGAGIVGASGLGSLAPEAAFAAPSVSDDALKALAGLPDPNFVEGVVTEISGTQLIVGPSSGGTDRIYVTHGTSIWKLHPASFDKIEVGDGLYSRGLRMPDGALAADAVWVNIVNIQAHVVSLSRNAIQLEHSGDRIVGHVIPGTSAVSYNSTPAVSDMSMLQVGQHVQVLGAWRPGTNEIDIATVYAHVHVH